MNFQAWLVQNKVDSLFAALIIIFTLFVFPWTRPYATPLGIIFILSWFWKWVRKGHHF